MTHSKTPSPADGAVEPNTKHTHNYFGEICLEFKNWLKAGHISCGHLCAKHHPHLAFMVGAGEGLTRRGCTGRLQNVTSFGAAALRVSLQHLHQICYEEVVLQGRHTLFRQDGGLSAYWAGQCQRLGRDVVL